MNVEALVKLIEEMVDLKVQQFAESTLKPSPEVARLLAEKRVTDRRRLEQIRTELVRMLAEMQATSAGVGGS
jgi:hypothetical protein